jgi:hypothetical protein
VVEDEEITRMRALRQISHFERHGVVDGVEIDLRHELLDPKEWGTSMIGNLSFTLDIYKGPFIWFPWYGNYDAGSLVKNMFGSTETDSKERQARHNYANYLLSKKRPECFVRAGDKVYIYRVSRVGVRSEFDHIHDTENRYAYLRVKRPGCKPISLKTPIEFIGYTAMGPANGKHYFSKIVSRICRSFAVRDIFEINAPEDDLTYRDASVIYACSIARRTKNIQEIVDKFFWSDVPSSEETRAAEKTMFLVNDAVLLGYLWAKAESEERMKPFAIEGLRSKEKKAVAGKISGATRRAEAEQGWRPHALELAKEIQAENQGLSQFDLARAIEDRWRLKIHCPKSQLAPAIRAWQKQGKLAKRKPHR